MVETKFSSLKENFDTAAVSAPERVSIARSENTELERRVLAHERILQALIAHMAEIEPEFIIRLTKKFCISERMARYEHDYTDTNSFAEQFIRTVIRLGDKPAQKASDSVSSNQLEHVTPSSDPGENLPVTEQPDFQVSQSGGIWRVTKNGKFHGDFSRKSHALESIDVARRAANPS